MRIVPVTFRQACAYVAEHHRHLKPPRGHKFSVGVSVGGVLVGVAMAGRPVARAYDDGLTIEVNRAATDGTRNVNSALYGAIWRASKAMGYLRAITYTQEGETGASLRAAGWLRVGERRARGSWAQSSVALRDMRDSEGSGGVARTLWRIGDPLSAEVEPRP